MFKLWGDNTRIKRDIATILSFPFRSLFRHSFSRFVLIASFRLLAGVNKWRYYAIVSHRNFQWKTFYEIVTRTTHRVLKTRQHEDMHRRKCKRKLIDCEDERLSFFGEMQLQCAQHRFHWWLNCDPITFSLFTDCTFYVVVSRTCICTPICD